MGNPCGEIRSGAVDTPSLTASMIFHRIFSTAIKAALLLAAGALISPALAQTGIAAGAGSVFKTDQVRAELMAHAPDGVGAGKPIWLGLRLAHQPGWHTYWKNPGDSGLPTVLRWELPPGVSAGDIAWPLPQRISIGNLANYGFEASALLAVPLRIAADFKPPPGSDQIAVRLKASWLVCKQECIPQEGEFALSLAVHGSSAVHRDVFDATLDAQPRTLAQDAASGAAASAVQIDGQTLKLSVQGLPASLQGRQLALFAETPELIETAAPWTQSWADGIWSARIPLSSHRNSSPDVMPVLLVGEVGGRAQGYRAELRVQGDWPAASGEVRGASAATPPDAVPMTLWVAMAGALLGGLILNLMPCVFPVLAIKLLAFARHADDRRTQRASGAAYTAGVVGSFLALGLLMLLLRGAGESLGWGFQLQNPAVVAALAALFSLMGLNLSGMFEFGQILPSGVLGLRARNPAADSFLSGVLAVAVAAPCSAPFMGASIGFAATLPPTEALAIFAAIGLGLALPYLAASLMPGLARALPRPGAWMGHLRQFMAFPMFATAVWLVWVLGQQSGIDGAAALLALLVALACLVWTLALSGRTRAISMALAATGLAALVWGLGPYIVRPVTPAADGASAAWGSWEPGRVEQLLAGQRPVFVDFSAAWCVTCQYNKQTTLRDPKLLADMAAKNVVLLRADWTRRDPAITDALRQLGRNGVPVYALYQSGKAPVLMSEIPSVAEVRSALAGL